MKVTATDRFYDAVAGLWRERGDSFEASPERVADINGAGWGDLVEPADEPKRRTQKKAD